MHKFKPLATPKEVGRSKLQPHVSAEPTNKPYMRASVGGAELSPEQLQEDLEEDPAYETFVESINGMIEKTRVVDFCPGEFASRMP
ncbi:dabb-domain-containing protein [Lasiosphaeria hispida]|uniref:Dabb-domain-containing protein n=1 Tax=Lasiosphaeria hispida TaxID=260671 RepID=A0AAJ0HC26_9PEZI|nr:dabb-domain-containing protein [Lasiosphaeria hispida]